MTRHRSEGFGVRDLTLHVRTGSHLLAGSEARVWMRLGNDSDRTQWFRTIPTSGSFRRGEVDTVELRLGPAVDPGRIDRIDVLHDGSGSMAGWYLESIEVDGQTLHYGCWLAKDEPPFRRDATSLYDEELRAYDVVVRTSEALFAGTDADVTIQLIGTRATTAPIRLFAPGRRLFESGQVDEFRLFAEDVGALLGVRLRVDGGGLLDGWRVDWVEVDRRRLAFDRWLARRSGDGRLDAFHRVRPWVVAEHPIDVSLCTFADQLDEANAALAQDLDTLNGVLNRFGVAVRRAAPRFDVVLPRSWPQWLVDASDANEAVARVSDARRLAQPVTPRRHLTATYIGALPYVIGVHPSLSTEATGLVISLPARVESSVVHAFGRCFGLAPTYGCEEADGATSRLRHLRNPSDVVDGDAENAMSQVDVPGRICTFTSGQVDAMVLRMLRYLA